MPRLTGNSVGSNQGHVFVDWGFISDPATQSTLVTWLVGWHFSAISPSRYDLDNGSFSAHSNPGGQRASWSAADIVGFGSLPSGEKDYHFRSADSFVVQHTPGQSATVTFIASAVGFSQGTSSLNQTVTLPAMPQPVAAPNRPNVSGNADSSPSTCTISWNAVSGATAYGLVVSDYGRLIEVNWAYHSIASGNPIPSGQTSLAVTVSSTRRRRYEARVWAYYPGSTGAIPPDTQSPILDFWVYDVPNTPPTPTSSGSGISRAVQWGASPTEDGRAAVTSYEWQRATNSGFSGALTGSASPSNRIASWSDLAPNTTYYFRVRAQNSVGFSAYSATHQFTTGNIPPNAPTGLNATVTGPASANASWTAPASNGGTAVTGYEIQRNTTPSSTGAITISLGNVTSTSWVNLTQNTTYHWRVRAINSAGAGAWSSWASFTTQAAGVKVWNGSAWVDATVWVWNGSAWVGPCELRTWNGSAWVNG